MSALPAEPVAVGFLDGSLEHSALSKPDKPDKDSHNVQPTKRRRRQNKSPASQSQSQPPWRGAIIENAKDAGSGLHACATGDVARLRALLAQGWDPTNVIDRQRSNGLHWAAGGGHLEVCQILLAHKGALSSRAAAGDSAQCGGRTLDVDATNGSSRTALHWAARNGHVATCTWLAAPTTPADHPLEAHDAGDSTSPGGNGDDSGGSGGGGGGGADVQLVSKDGVNVFHWAVWSGSLPTCRWALEQGGQTMARAVNRWGCDATHWAAATGSVALCAWVQEKAGLSFEKRNNQGHDGLMKAAWNGHGKLCRYLLGLASSKDHALATSAGTTNAPQGSVTDAQGSLGAQEVDSLSASSLPMPLLPPPATHAADPDPIGTETKMTPDPRHCARAARLLRRVDRAGLCAAQLAHINGHTDLSSWLRNVARCLVSQEGDGGDSAGADAEACDGDGDSDGDELGADSVRMGAEYELYYRRVVPAVVWAAFAKAIMSGLPRTVWRWRWCSQRACMQLDCAQIAQRRWRTDSSLRDRVTAALGNGPGSGRGRGYAVPLPPEWCVEEALPLLLLHLCPSADQLVWHMCADRAVSTAVACLGMMCEGRGDCDRADRDKIARSGNVHEHSGQTLGGVLVANGIDPKVFLSISAATRLLGRDAGTGAAAVVATVSNAARFPCLFNGHVDETSGGGGAEDDAVETVIDGARAHDAVPRQILFDRILCNPPSSRDGALRCAPERWQDWTISSGLENHARQLKILLRGLHLLKPRASVQQDQGESLHGSGRDASDGRLVYFVRSLNPIEAEAVVASALSRYRGTVRLVGGVREALEGAAGIRCVPLEAALPDTGMPCSAASAGSPGVGEAKADEKAGAGAAKRSGTAPGPHGQPCSLHVADPVTTWEVPDPERASYFRYFSSWDEVPAGRRVPKGAVCASMFPPPQKNVADVSMDLDVAQELRKCVRVMPQQRQDSSEIEGECHGAESQAKLECGGCFMAVFEKLAHRDADVSDWRGRAAAATYGVPGFARTLLPAVPSISLPQNPSLAVACDADTPDAHLSEIIAFYGLKVRSHGGMIGTSVGHIDAKHLAWEVKPGAKGAFNTKAKAKNKDKTRNNVAPKETFSSPVDSIPTVAAEQEPVCEANCGDNQTKPRESFAAHARSLVLLTAAAARLLLRADPPLARAPGVHVASAGLKLFEPFPKGFLSGCACRWRPSVEGAEWLAGAATKRVYTFPVANFAGSAARVSVPLASRVIAQLLQKRSMKLAVLDSSGVKVEPSCDHSPCDTSALSLQDLEVGGLLLGIASDRGVHFFPCLISHTELRVMLAPDAAMDVLENACGGAAVARHVLSLELDA